MLRHVLTAAAVLSLLSSAAFANDFADGSTKKVITRVGPNGTSKTIVRHHVNRYGDMVTRHKTVTEGLSGSTVNRSKTITDPDTGHTVTKSITKER